MKTVEDLKKLFPTLIELVANNDHKIGESYMERDEEGCSRYEEFANNYVCYEEDGWGIDIYYRCTGEWVSDSDDLKRAYGEVTEICAYYYDEDTDEEFEFSDEDLEELYSQLDGVLKIIS